METAKFTINSKCTDARTHYTPPPHTQRERMAERTRERKRRVNLTEMKNLYREHFKTLKNEIEYSIKNILEKKDLFYSWI